MLFHEQVQQWQSPATRVKHEMGYTPITPAIYTNAIFPASPDHAEGLRLNAER